MNKSYLVRQRRLAALRIRAEVERRRAQRVAIPAQQTAAGKTGTPTR
ncbi:hypothetical protein [Flindersiella endophytica]